MQLAVRVHVDFRIGFPILFLMFQLTLGLNLQNLLVYGYNKLLQLFVEKHQFFN